MDPDECEDALTNPSAVGDRGEILRAVARVTELISSSIPWRDTMPEALAILGGATKVSRVYIFEIEHIPEPIVESHSHSPLCENVVQAGDLPVERGASADKQDNDNNRQNHREIYVSQRYEWVADGIEPQIANPDLQMIPLIEAGYLRWCDLLQSKQPVCGSIIDFPDSEKPLLESQSILSLLIQPIFAGSRWWGFIGFDACLRAKNWHQHEIDALRVASLVIGGRIFLQEREAQLRLVQKMEALGQMAGGVAHDFNNVLQIASGALAQIQNDLRINNNMSARLLSYVSILEKTVQKGADLTRRLLEFSRRRESSPKEVFLCDLVLHERLLIQQALGPKITFDFKCSHSIYPVSLDPVQFAQILLNLAVNARDAMPDGGLFEIAMLTLESSQEPLLSDGLPEGRYTLVRFRDSGVGIAPEIQERIFEPFFSVGKRNQGTGLGLSTVYSVVMGASGRIFVSSSKGQGTEFRVYFPACGEPRLCGHLVRVLVMGRVIIASV